MAREGEIDVEDEDIRSGSLDSVAQILTALGYRASETSTGELTFLSSSSGGFAFHIFATPNIPGGHSWFIFSASFPGVRFTLSDANRWNSQPINAVATLDEQGDPRLTFSIVRGELTVLGFTQNLGLWFHMLERFGSHLRNLD